MSPQMCKVCHGWFQPQRTEGLAWTGRKSGANPAQEIDSVIDSEIDFFGNDLAFWGDEETELEV